MQETAQQVEVSPHLTTAYSIARKLAKEAIWSDDGRCNWQGASVEVVGEQYKVLTRTFGPDLYNGTSGIALFLAEMAIRVEDFVIHETLRGAVKNVLHQVKTTPQLSQYGVYSGSLGIGYALWKIGVTTKNDEWTKQGLNMVLELGHQEVGDHEIDVIAGAAGAVPVLLKIHQKEQHPTLLQMATKCADFLMNKAIKTETSWTWETIPGNEGLTGYSHGTAGISLALLELGVALDKQEYTQAAMKGFQYEREHFVAHQKNWPDLRNGVKPAEGTGKPHVCCEMWCHGAPGIALSRLRAYELTQNQEFLKEAQVALDTTYQSVMKEVNAPMNSNFSLCHGLAGNSDILLTAAKLYQVEAYAQLASKVGVIGEQLYNAQDLDWPSGVNDPTGLTQGKEPTPGLMLGLAGTGYFYLRLADPQNVENILMIN